MAVLRSQSRTRRFIVLITFDLYSYRLLTFPEIRARMCYRRTRAHIFALPRISERFPSKTQQTLIRRSTIYTCIRDISVILSDSAASRLSADSAICKRGAVLPPSLYIRSAVTVKEVLAGPDDIDSVLIGNSVNARCPLIKLIN